MFDSWELREGKWTGNLAAVLTGDESLVGAGAFRRKIDPPSIIGWEDFCGDGE